MEIILICVVVGIWIWIVKYIKNNNYDEKEFEETSKLILEWLHVAERFAKDTYWKDNILGVHLLIYAPDITHERKYGYSKHICLISISLLEDNINIIREKIKDKEIIDWFKLDNSRYSPDHWYFEYEFTFYRWTQKALTKRLYNTIKQEFPNAKYKLTDNSINIDFT